MVRQRQHVDIADVADELPSEPPASPERIEHCVRALVMFESLPDQQRRALFLRAVEGRSYAEIAALLGCTARTVRQYCSLATRRMRGALGERS